MRAASALFALAMMPAMAALAHVHLAVREAPVVAGEAKDYAVDLQTDEGPGDADRPLRISVNVGTFGPVKRVSAGHYETTYRPPETKFPQAAIVAIWRETGTNAAVEFSEIPVYGHTLVPVTSDPNVKVTVGVGTVESAPTTTDASGKAQVPVLVVPGIHEATVTATSTKGGVSKKKAPLNVPPYNRLTVAVVPHAVVADGRSSARIHVYVAGGRHESKVQVEASTGTVVTEKPESPDHLVFAYTPAKGAKGWVTFSASIIGDRVSSHTATLALGEQQPAKLVIRPPEKLEFGTPAEIRVLVLDESGLGVADKPVTLAAPGLEIKARRDSGDGTYAFDSVVIAYPSGGSLDLSASLALAPGQSLSAHEAVPVHRPVGARSARFDSAPKFVWAGSVSVGISATVLDATGTPIPPDGVTMIALGADLSEVKEVGDHLEAELKPPRFPHEVKLEVVTPDGRALAEHVIEIGGDDGRLYLGARVGAPGDFAALLIPRLALEATARPKMLEDQILIGLLVAETAGKVPDIRETPSTGLTSENVFSLSLRVTLDDFKFGPFSFQPGVAAIGAWVHPLGSTSGCPPLVSHFAAGASIFATAFARLGPGQFLIEVGYGVTSIAKADLSMNAAGLYIDAGYRVAMF
jgi:hypothetical protein